MTGFTPSPSRFVCASVCLLLAAASSGCEERQDDPMSTAEDAGDGMDGGGATAADAGVEDGGDDGPVPDGPSHACESPELTAMVARLDEGFSPEPRAQLSALFFAGGALRSVDGQECTPGTDLPNPHEDRANFADCFESYTCGGCPFWVIYDADDQLYGLDSGGWYLVGEFPDDPDAVVCEEHLGLYRLVDPDTVTHPADNDAEPSGGAGDVCSACLSDCQNVPGTSCCTGSGCLCEDECRPAPSDCGTRTFCCGPYGDCICTNNCPY